MELAGKMSGLRQCLGLAVCLWWLVAPGCALRFLEGQSPDGRIVRNVPEGPALGSRWRRGAGMGQIQRMSMPAMAPAPALDLAAALSSLNKKPSYVSSVSQSHAQKIDTKNPGLSLADSLAFTLDIQGPLGDSTSEYQGNQNFGKGAQSSAASKAGSGKKGDPALAAADTSADIVTDGDPTSQGSASTINKANVVMHGNAAGISNARGSVGPASAPAGPAPAIAPPETTNVIVKPPPGPAFGPQRTQPQPSPPGPIANPDNDSDFTPPVTNTGRRHHNRDRDRDRNGGRGGFGSPGFGGGFPAGNGNFGGGFGNGNFGGGGGGFGDFNGGSRPDRGGGGGFDGSGSRERGM